MSITFLYQVAAVPSVLLALAGMLLLRGDDEVRAGRRFLVFFIVAGATLLLAVFLTAPGYEEPYRRFSFELPTIVTPAVMGILALIILNLKRISSMTTPLKMMTILLLLGIVILLGLLWNSRLAVGYFVLPGAFVLSFFWVIGRRHAWFPAVIGLLALGIIYLFDWFVRSFDQTTSVWLSVLFMLFLYLAPAVLVIMPARLVTKGLQDMVTGEYIESNSRSNRGLIFRFILAILLLVSLAYIILWGGIWDQTQDMGFGFIISPIAGVLAIATGMLMTATLPDKFRTVGLLYLILVPLLLYQMYDSGAEIPHHEITEKRAERIAEALDKYYERVGYYPESLQALTPRDLLFVQQPVILMGERWCYQGGEDYYRLSAFYREFWSAPVSLRIYESAGELPTSPAVCEDRLAEMKERYYSPMEDPSAMQPPLPTPLPENEVGIPKTDVQPLLNGAVVIPGSWSPDSDYFVFGTQTTDLSLHFLIGETGDVCTANEQFTRMDTLRGYHVWLPDGRLLFMDSSGKMMALTPCQIEGEQLEERFSESFTQIVAHTQEGGHILLKSEKSYWILNGQTLTAQLIPEVTPIPYDLHWDAYAWLPGGKRLAIARLNGRKGSNAGSILYLIDGGTGRVENSFPLYGDFGQSSPWVEGLSDHELLVHGIGELLIIDFSAEPPRVTNVLADMLGLDIRYPDEASAAGSFVDPRTGEYYLAVRLNHPRNQATYLYDSQTRRVHIYDHEHHTLLLFPNGYLMEMAKQEDVLTYQDEYDIVLVDEPETVQPRLKLSGHTPREYPHLSFVYLVKRSQLAVASAQGVSLVSLPDGEMIAYWELMGDGFSPFLIAAPDGSALIASKDFGGLYYIPLPPRE